VTVTTLDPTTALVVVDLQKGLAGAPGFDGALARSVELAGAFRSHDLPVILVRVTDGAQVPGRIDGVRRQRERAAGWDEIVDELTGPDDIVVTKRNWGAFYGTDLDLQLRRRGVTQVVLTGVATSIGVESTARAAHEHGYHVTLAVDAMADIDPETHRNSIERIFPRLGETGTTAEILDVLAKTHG
jgi:nicotinamidase-related amidase